MELLPHSADEARGLRSKDKTGSLMYPFFPKPAW